MVDILLLENHQGIAETVASIFENQEGYRVFYTRALTDLTQALKARTYDIMVSDCIFPGGDFPKEEFRRRCENGLACEEYIVSQVKEKQPDLPIVFYTTKRPDSSLHEILQANPKYSYFRKPVLIADIIAKIEQTLNK